ncbi:hypothetical protein BJ166DRAFT_11800 [Pestalotiopsis sp. NC0098]|nr:hypothetical protein BJ166DRAFT_11800 [Pestalotiopsis sp. NC0098]
MSRALWSAGPLKPDVRLAQAVSVFEASLSSDEKARLRSSRSQSQNKAPTIDDVMRFTAEVDARARSLLGSGRCFGPRLTYLLQTVQQFAALGDILIGGSQNLIACGVWSVVRMAIMAATVSASTTERLSLLFMTAGKSAPRYQQLALLYAKSRLIRDYLAEYMIIIVQMCHYFHDFSRKSTIGQITSSLSDAKIRNAEEELNRWGQLIKDEASLLLAQTTQDEAAESSKSRKWLSRSVDSISHQQNIDRRLKWLAAFSTFDHETPWKQARKRGSSTFFVDMAGYKQWKEKQGPQGLLLSGKMGCGKSVTMANMVDDLYLSCRQDTVIYFFCRYDIPESLKARTILGSLAAQITQRYLDTDVMDEVFIRAVSLMSLDKILSIIPRMIRQTTGVRLVLDGIDECSEEEVDLICSSLQHLQQSCSLYFCVSYRDQAEGVQAKLLKIGQTPTLSVPYDNPDIREFIGSELQKMGQSGKLSVGDPKLLTTIRETLLRGADGMFLWVALQMDTICAQRTDNAIQQALDNLPKGLSATFRRILTSSKQEGRCYQKDILKILVGATRPLVMDEFREALSVTPGDTVWDPRKLINNIQSTLACCGSLVVIDEEERTVRLLHQSVAQFLQEITPDLTQWSFSAQDASSLLGSITVTYLNYGVFDRQLSRQVIPRIDAREAPDKIIAQTLRPLGTMAQKLANTRLIPQRSLNRDIGEVLFNAGSSRWSNMPTENVFHLLAYCSENLLSHTSSMSYDPPTVRLFERLLSDPQFAPWSALEDGSFDYLVGQKRNSIFRESDPTGSISQLREAKSSRRSNITSKSSSQLGNKKPKISARMKWAILHPHSLIFSMELRSGSGIGTLSSVISFLHELMKDDRRPKLAPPMCDKLLLIATSLRAAQTTYWLIESLGCSLDQYLKLLTDHSSFDYATLRWITVHQFFNLHNLREPWIELAVAHGDARAVRSLLKQGASLNIFASKSPIQSAMHSCLFRPESLLMASYILERAQFSDVLRMNPPEVLGFLSAFARHGNIYRGQNANTMTNAVLDYWFNFGQTLNSKRMILALKHAYQRGEPRLTQLMIDVLRSVQDRELSALIDEALSCRSDERSKLVISILSARHLRTELPEELYRPALMRSVQLRDWRSAFAIAELSPFLGIRSYVDKGRPHTRMGSSDFDGLCFLLSPAATYDVQRRSTSADSLIENQPNITEPFPHAWMATCESLDDCYVLFKVVLRMNRLRLRSHDGVWHIWTIEDYNESIVGVFKLILSFLAKDNSNLEGEPGSTALSLSKSSLLYHLDVFLEDMSESSITEVLWGGTFTAILECYQYTTSQLHRIRDKELNLRGNLALVENINVLKLGTVTMAETLMRVRAALEQRGVLGRNISAPRSSALDDYMGRWRVTGVMGLVFWKYYYIRKRYHGNFDWQVDIRDPIQESYMPLGWEVCAIGTKAAKILAVYGGSMDHLRAAELSLFRTKWSEETRMVDTIRAWRAVTDEKPSVEDRAELPA